MGWFELSNLLERAYDYFRPRLGLGWFTKQVKSMSVGNDFRPRVGMGWFVEDVEGVAVHKVIFVPEWGWVGSMRF